jgi:UDP-N-acetylmuramyl pentapeptide phosphotransferase/UDP-N-acetylglucosamine-1-phosphate transferase
MTIEAIIKYPAVFLSAALLSVLLTRFWGLRALRWGFVDMPGGRKIHSAPVPTAGGLAIFLAFHGACALIFLYPWEPFSGQIRIDWWFRFIPLSCALIAVGLLDDRFSLKPLVKLAGQVVVATAAYALDIRVQNVLGATLPGYFDFIVTILWFLLLMNSFNLIDGIDGLATGIAFIAAIGIAISLVFRTEPIDVLLFLGFAGACLGFLRYNFYPARIFLGDTGSLFLGFTLAAMAISTNSKGPTMAAMGMPLLAVGVPLFDTLLAIWRRSVRHLLSKEENSVLMGVEQADDEHLHHRLLTGGREHSQVALVLYGATVVLAVIGVLVSIFHDRAIGILALAFLVGSYTVIKHLAWIELRDSGEAVLRGLTQPVRRNRTLIAYVLLDLLILNVALLVVNQAVAYMGAEAAFDSKKHWLRYAPFDIGLPFLLLVFFRAYSRVWYLARISEFASIGLAVGLGYLAALAIHLTGAGATAATGTWVIRALMMAGVAGPMIIGSRASLRVVQDLMHWFARGLQRDRSRGVRTLIGGAGFRATLFLRQMTLRRDDAAPLEVVGLVDSDDAVRNHYVHGIRVLGNWHDLPRLIALHRIDAVYIVEELDAAQIEQIRASVRETGAKLLRWSLTEESL